MAALTTSFSTLQEIETAYSLIANASWDVTDAVNYAVAAYDYAKYYGISSFTSQTSTYVAGSNVVGDSVAVIGSNLLGYPYTITQLDYTFNPESVAIVLNGSVGRSSSLSDLTGNISRVHVSTSTQGYVIIEGNENINIIGDGTINTVVLSQSGASIQLDGSMSASTSIVSNYYRTTFGGSYDSIHVIHNTESLTLLGVNVSVTTSFGSMENALESLLGSNDTLSGTSGDQWFAGYGGNDSIDGGTDIDTAHYSGNRSDYVITAITGGYSIADGVAGRDGTDSLYSIERLEFADVAMNLGSNNAPTGSLSITGTAIQGNTLSV